MFEAFRARLRSLVSPAAVDRELDEELRAHLDREIERTMVAGMTRGDATAAARRRFGNVPALTAEARDALGTRLVGDLWTDLRYAWRTLTRNPALAIVTIVTLTLGIGANAVMFGVVDELLLRPPAHVANASELRQVYFHAKDEDGKYEYAETTFYGMVRALRERVSSFADVVGAYRSSFILGRGTEAEPIDVSLVDGTYFTTLGVRPSAGRFFAPDETRVPDGARVAVIGERFRQRHFDRLANPIGQTIVVDERPFTIIGMTPAGFTGVDRESNIDVWVPIASLAPEKLLTNAGRVHVIARLRPGIPADRGAAEATLVARRVVRELDDSSRDTLTTAVLGSINNLVEPGGVSSVVRTSLWLMGVSAIVLLIAAANVANLLIARAVQRRRETAVRLALGVSRGRLLRQLLTEALMLATIAGAVAVVASSWTGRIVQRLLLPGFAWSGELVDRRVLGFTVVVMLVACVLAGLAPILHGLRTDVNHALKAGSREWTGSRSWFRRVLLVTQAALSVVLLVGSGLFVRSLSNVRSVDVGIDLDRVLMATMNLDRAGFDSTRQRLLLETAIERLQRVPSVAAATVLSASTPTRVGNSIQVVVPGIDTGHAPPNGGPYFFVIDSSFLRVLGAKLLRGRALLPAETRTRSRVALVNQATADFYWPGQDPLGKCMIIGRDDTCTEIVGVVQPVLFFRIVNEASYAQLFIPPTHPSAGNRPRTLLIRSAADPRIAATESRRVLQDLAPNMPYVSVRSIADIVSPQVRPWRLGATMFTIFGCVALAIAAIGLYSVMAYWVTQRRFEFGVRVALGARRGDIWRLVASEAARTIGVGLALGLAVAALAAPRAADLLYRTSPRDGTVYAGVAGLLALAAFLATIIPTHRSTQVSSATALRAE